MDAFEIIKILELRDGLKTKNSQTLTSVDLNNLNLFLGCSNGEIQHYLLDFVESELIYNQKLLNSKKFKTTKPITHIIASIRIQKVIVALGGKILLLDVKNLKPLNLDAISKSLSTEPSCLIKNSLPQEKDPDYEEVAIGFLKKTLMILRLHFNTIEIVSERNLPEIPQMLAFCENSILVAGESTYYLYTKDATEPIPMMTYSTTFCPLVKTLSPGIFMFSDEFSKLGMLVDTSGCPSGDRDPVVYQEAMRNFLFRPPYDIIVGLDGVFVYSDHKMIQKIDLKNIVCLGYNDSITFLSTTTCVYGLYEIPVTQQIKFLFANSEIDHAVKVAESSGYKHGEPIQQQIYHGWMMEAGIAYMVDGRFDETQITFEKINPDICFLIDLIPGLRIGIYEESKVPDSKTYKDFSKKMTFNKEFDLKVKSYIVSLLENSRHFSYYSTFLSNIETAMIIIYAELNSPRLYELVQSKNMSSYVETSKALLKFHRFHAYACYIFTRGKHIDAFKIWKSLLEKVKEDSYFPGFSTLIEHVPRILNETIFWTIINWTFEWNAMEAVKIFIQVRVLGETESLVLSTDAILNYLNPYTEAKIVFLEYLVNVEKSDTPAIHTNLGMLYLDQVLTIHEDGKTDPEMRSKLLHFLKFSEYYIPSMLMVRLGDAELNEERIIVLKKLGHHTQALKIIVDVLKNYEMAEQYCDEVYHSNQSSSESSSIYLKLLEIYTNKIDVLQKGSRERIRSLINRRANVIEPLKALEMIPDNVSIHAISEYLSGALKTRSQNVFSQSIHYSLKMSELLKEKYKFLSKFNKFVVVNEESICAVCHQFFLEPSAVHLSDGSLVHFRCQDSIND